MSDPKEITMILSAIGRGQKQAARDLLPIVYEEVRRLAGAQMARERSDHTLQPTALAHEAYMRLVGDENPKMADRRYFYAAVGQAMRRVLVEHARHHKDQVRLATDAGLDSDDTSAASLDWAGLDHALDELAQEDNRLAEVVHLRFFAGLSHAETAEALGVSLPTVKRDWAYARARLIELLGVSE